MNSRVVSREYLRVSSCVENPVSITVRISQRFARPAPGEQHPSSSKFRSEGGR